MTVSFWQQPSRVLQSHALQPVDVAVVGGGIIGCAAAYWIGRARPGWRVAILEAHTIGHGASGRNAGFLIQGTDTDYRTAADRYGADAAAQIWHFTRETRALIEAELDPAAFDFVPSGSLTVAGTDDEDARLQASVAPLRAIGASARYLTPTETNRRIEAQGFRGSLLVDAGAMLHPHKLVRHIAAASGATVLEHHRVRSVDATEKGVRLETAHEPIVAGRVVLALGAYLPHLMPSLGRYVRPRRAQMLATAPTDGRLDLPVYSHDGEFYIRQAPDGSVLLGGARHRNKAVEVGYDDTTTAAVQADLEAYLTRHFPWASALPIARRWSGTMGFSPDGLPVVGALPRGAGYWATGFTGHGMSFGFRFGRLLADLVVGTTSLSAEPLFAASRFH